LTVHCK